MLLVTLAACRGGAIPRQEASPDAGFALAERLGCGGCHAGAPATSAPRLKHIGERHTPFAIRESLAEHPRLPEDVDPGTLLAHLLARGQHRPGGEQRLELGAVERGRQLYHSIGCVACHEPFEPADSLQLPLWAYPEVFEPAPAAPERGPHDSLVLRGIARRFFRDTLAEFLRDPLSAYPDGRMPDLSVTEEEADDLAAYLWYEDAVERGAAVTRAPGLALEVFEGNFGGATVDYDALEPVRREVATSFFEGIAHRADDFAFRFRGFLEVPEAGEYAFSTTSDDGSMLYVDGQRVVDNDGPHAMTKVTGRVTLEAGPHPLEVTYFEHTVDEGLEVRWQGPGFEERPLGPEGLSHLEVVAPAAPALAEAVPAPAGPAPFLRLGCTGCHDAGPRGPAFDTLRPGHGCLADDPPPTLPRYTLTRAERGALAAAMAAGAPPAEPAAARLVREVERLRCGACHAREGLLDGPDAAHQGYFRTVGDLDLGDEGRLPPRLDAVGAKLKPEWLREVLVEGARVRPYMRTRMPRFGEANVLPLAEMLEAVDEPLRDTREPGFSAEAVEIGRRLAGTKGLGCIQCHDLAGHPSIGIPAVDLAHVHERIYPGWFRRLLMDPIALKMNTRMPTFWEGGKSPVDVLDGDPARQVDALWTYLSLGTSMPLPEGLVPLPNEYEVEVTDRPVSVGVFMKDISPRTVCVGYPERLSIAYDVQNCRLAMAWRGRFLDARGTWFGRAGQLEEPAGEDVIVLPRGPGVSSSFRFEEAGSAYRVLGRRIDSMGRPTFRYMFGQTLVEETIVPVLHPGGVGFTRRFALTAPWAADLEVPLAIGGFRKEGESFVVEGSPGYRISLRGDARFGQTQPNHGISPELFVRVETKATPDADPEAPFHPDTVVFEIEYSW